LDLFGLVLADVDAKGGLDLFGVLSLGDWQPLNRVFPHVIVLNAVPSRILAGSRPAAPAVFTAIARFRSP